MQKMQLQYLLTKIDQLEKAVKQLEGKQSLEQYFTVQEVADSLALNPVTIVRKIHDREIKAIKIGKEFRIEKKAIEDYILSFCTVDYTPND